MVMRADVLARALNEGAVKAGGYDTLEQLEVIYTSPRGETWNHDLCQEFAQTYFHDDSRDLVFICGRYEGIDERFIERYVTRILSLGDYVLTGGELAVMAMIDSFVRFIPGVLGNRQSALEESFQSGLLEHPQYTRPRVFEGLEVPQVLLSGHHEKIQAYQTAEQLRLTKLHRPELLPKKDHP
jgi:tRNA (guanine37-N1)-methyltransferase